MAANMAASNDDKQNVLSNFNKQVRVIFSTKSSSCETKTKNSSNNCLKLKYIAYFLIWRVAFWLFELHHNFNIQDGG